MITNRLKWAPLLGLLLLGSCAKEEDAPEPTTYTKEVTLHLFTETDYRDDRWKDSKMKLSLTLKRSRQDLQQETVVLDTTLNWMPFQELPVAAGKLRVVKRLREVNRLQEDVTLQVAKVVSINGYETVFTYSQTLDRQKPAETVEVKL